MVPQQLHIIDPDQRILTYDTFHLLLLFVVYCSFCVGIVVCCLLFVVVCCCCLLLLLLSLSLSLLIIVGCCYRMWLYDDIVVVDLFVVVFGCCHNMVDIVRPCSP
jgi:hypothetical protein